MLDRIGVGRCRNLRWDAGMLVILVLAGRPTPSNAAAAHIHQECQHGTAPYRTNLLPTNSREERVN